MGFSLTAIQDDDFWGGESWSDNTTAGSIFRAARDAYLRAAAIMEIRNEFTELLPNVVTFQTSAVRGVFLRLAQEYRSLPESAQLWMVPYAEADPELQLVKRWRGWFHSRLDQLARRPQFVRAVCTAVVYPNLDRRGVEAEKYLWESLGPENWGMERCQA